MSHFAILVIGTNIDEQLAPYDEDIDVEPYPRTTREQSAEERANKLKLFDSSDHGFRDEYVARVRAMTDEEYFQDKIDEGDDLDEDGNPLTTYNPKSKWDWYSIGGRWTGSLKLHDEHIKDRSSWEHITIGEPGLMTSPAERGTCDGALKRMIDWDGMRDEAGERAAAYYDGITAIVNELPKGQRTWTAFNDVRDRFDTIEGAREHYYNQPALRLLKARDDYQWAFFEGIDWYLTTRREDYIENARLNACVFFGIVKDGEWHERGSMGWWGIVSDKKEDWADTFNKIMDTVGDDEMVTIVDCHI